jgi:hypothetical protein
MHLDRGSAEESFANRGGKCGALGGHLGAFPAMKSEPEPRLFV